MIDFIYSPDYLDWNLGEDHPTDPRRAKRALDMLGVMDVPHRVLDPRMATNDEILRVHTPEYLAGVHAGRSGEWEGVNVRLGRTALLMAGGTMTAVDRVLAGQGWHQFNPQGAKHHAQRNESSGFCVLNDMAMAAHRLNEEGKRVAYIDWDVHHGDGVENLTRLFPDTLTASIHGEGFPGTGEAHDAKHDAFNWMLPPGSDNDPWLCAVEDAIGAASAFDPDVILLATGADAHLTDPLGSLRVTVEGYEEAARLLRRFADDLSIPIIVGGAGGYQPRTWTPMIWATVARVLADDAKHVYPHGIGW